MAIQLRLIVEDRHGVLDRISGLIRRNGWNISEMNAGETNGGKSYINIRIKDKGADLGPLGKSLSRLDCVEHWEECSDQTHFTRELFLFSVPAADYRDGLFENAEIIERTDEIICLSRIASAAEIDALLERHGTGFCDYSRSGAMSVKRSAASDERKEISNSRN